MDWQQVRILQNSFMMYDNCSTSHLKVVVIVATIRLLWLQEMKRFDFFPPAMKEFLVGCDKLIVLLANKLELLNTRKVCFLLF